MSNVYLSIIWGAFYIACAGLGFIAAPEGFVYGLCVVMSIVFFIPPSVLLYRAVRAGDRKMLRWIRNISLVWLLTAMVMIILNILSVIATKLTGLVLYYMMVILTAPMISGQAWVIALFGWACLLVVSWQQLRKINGKT